MNDLTKKTAIWSRHGREVRIRVVDNEDRETEGKAFIKSWDQRGRSLRALKWLGLVWAAAAAAVFIPVAHLILVPSLVLAGPLVACIVYRLESVVLGGIATCPGCNQVFYLSRSKVVWPLAEVCSHCRRGMRVELL